jgi:hypothetical protein
VSGTTESLPNNHQRRLSKERLSLDSGQRLGLLEPLAHFDLDDGNLSHAEDDDGFVVEAVLLALESCNVGEDGVGDVLSGRSRGGRRAGRTSGLHRTFRLGVFGVEDAVGDENDGVAGLGGDA